MSIDTGSSPFTSDSYYSYPGTNLQLEINGTIIDIFRWRIIAEDIKDIHISAKAISWSGMEEHQININSDFLHIQNNQSIYYVDLIPWSEIGEIAPSYLKSLELHIQVDGNGEFISGHDVKQNNRLQIPRSGQTDETEYLILTNSSLLPAAEIVAELHENEVINEQRLITSIALVDTISSSIRQFLLNELSNNDMLKYVLLLGDEIILPPMTTLTYDPDVGALIERPSDDFYTSEPEESAYAQVITGRIPVNDLDLALVYVTRLREYVLNPSPGSWKNSITMLADDTNKSGGNIVIEISHTANSNILYQMLNEDLEITTIYGPDFTPVSGEGNLRQPEMTAGTLESINTGISMINYIGHGSATTLADEFIVDLDRDINSINDPVGSIWVVGTCSFGWYDNKECMTERLLTIENGAIGVISTTFKVSVTTNFQYLLKLFQNIQDFINNENDYRLGDLVYHSKEGGLDYWFHVFGDPALPLPFPKKADIINETQTSDVLQVLEPFNININPEFTSAPVFTTIRGPESIITKVFDQGGSSYTFNYIHPGEIIYRGAIQQDFSIFVPIDINLCENCEGSFNVFADRIPQNEQFYTYTDGLMNIPILPLSGNSDDMLGPEIFLSQNQTNIANPGIISLTSPYEITITLSDDSGINVTSSTGHQLRYWFEDNLEPHIFSADFTFTTANEGSYSFIVPINDRVNQLLYVEAWDNVNNRSDGQFSLVFSPESSFSIDHIYNYPNPFKDETNFTFFLSHPGKVTITVITTEGRKIIKIISDNLNSGYQSIPWNGENSHGIAIGNGTYFYHIRAQSVTGKEFESIEKLTKLK